MCYFTYERQSQWVQWLPLAEWWYNTTYHGATCKTPFEDVYGQKPPYVLSYIYGVSKVQEVENKLIARDEILRTLKENLAVAQNRMKQQADKHHCERHFEEGDQVFLRLQPYKQTSLKDNHCQNIYPKFYGPYKVLLKCFGPVAYKLEFPSHSKIHPIFHVSCINKVVGYNFPN